MTITDEKLRKLVSLMVERKLVVLREAKKFQAIRSLTIQAQEAAMKFEDSMIKALGIDDPDNLPDHEQAIYSQAMADMHSKVIEAVVHAADVVKSLQSRPEEQEKPAGSKQAKTTTAATAVGSSTVNKPLPTL